MGKREMESRQAAIRREWLAFRKEFLFTQVRFAEVLGISRRMVQYVESGKGQFDTFTCIPRAETQLRFRALKGRHEKEKH